MSSVCVLLPAKNEAECIGRVINEVPLDILTSAGYHAWITVADGQSSDDTVKIAIQKGCRVLHCNNKGKGSSVKVALSYLKLNGWQVDYLFMLDADGTYPAGNITTMMQMLVKDMADVVIGSRLHGRIEPGAMSERNYWGNVQLTNLANMLYRTKTTDLCTGLWGFNKKALDSIKITANGFDLEANLFTEVNRNKLRLASMPITYRARFGSKSTLKMSDGFKIARRLVQEKFR